MKKKVVKLTESDLVRIVKKIINEQNVELEGMRDSKGNIIVNGAKTDQERSEVLKVGINKLNSNKSLVESDKLPFNGRVYCSWRTGYMEVFSKNDFSSNSLVGAVAVDGYPTGYKSKPLNRDNQVSNGYAELQFIFSNGLVDKYSFPDVGLDPTKVKYFTKQI
jgi:hypothetical protein